MALTCYLVSSADTLFVDFGAGRAELSRQLADAMSMSAKTDDKNSNQYLIVEQAGGFID